jgi:hypothetical protein
VKALFDTNILVDYLNGVGEAREEIDRYETRLISPITWMEVMVGADEAEDQAVRTFLARFTQVGIDARVAETAVGLRREHGIRLPDAIIWASAKRENALLVSRNRRDFPPGLPEVRIPYRL